MRILGHPVHPMLVVFPLGLFVVAIIFDIVDFAGAGSVLAPTTFYMIAAGVVGGLLAAVFGFLDWMKLPRGSRARHLGAWHGGGNFTITVLFLISWLLRLGAPNHAPSVLAFILVLVGGAMALVTAWLGGELVYRLGSQVDDGANPNAPSSLSDKPASATDRDQGRQAAD